MAIYFESVKFKIEDGTLKIPYSKKYSIEKIRPKIKEKVTGFDLKICYYWNSEKRREADLKHAVTLLQSEAKYMSEVLKEDRLREESFSEKPD